MSKKQPENSETAHPDEMREAFEARPVLTGRRAFFARIAETAAACVAVLFAIPFVRYLFYPVSVIGASNGWTNIGSDTYFTSLTAPVARWITVSQNDGWLQSQSKKAIYITKDAQGQVEALSAVCPHLGCTVQWRQRRRQFICPCHGSIFAPDGARIAGPAPRGMDSLPIQVQNGNLLVKYEDFQQLLPTKEVLS
jgi:menaquinol-cytochrome c reductase iron-sulfur subunit